MFDVVGVGLNAIDYLVGLPGFPARGEKLRMSSFAREGGGQVATALVALSRWGRRCKYVGNVGDDDHGRLSTRLLSLEGIDLSHVRAVPGAASQFAVILVEESTGVRTILWDRDPKIRVSPEDLPYDDIRRARALLLDGHDVPAAIAAAGAARARASPSSSTRKRCRRGTEELLPLLRPHRGRGPLPGLLFPGLPGGRRAGILRRYSPPHRP
jgi:sugar/nucleoside kinase (ribokinase family)